jgi:dTMP kinase
VIIGIEGVSCVGKTALASALAERLGSATVIPCFFYCVADPATLPPPVAPTGRAQLESLEAFLDVEADRRKRALAGQSAGRTVVLDRTVDTLLAHTAAVSRLMGFDTDVVAREIVRHRSVTVPDLTLILTARFEILRRRAARRPAMPEILYGPRFATHFIDHFRHPIAPVCVILDAEQPLPALLECALHVLDVRAPAAVGAQDERKAPA